MTMEKLDIETETTLEKRRDALEKKHELMQKKTNIEKDIEKVELETEMAASDAKIHVLQNAVVEATPRRSVIFDTPGDGMNNYLNSHDQNVKEEHQLEFSPVEYARISVVPKTPLQRVLVPDVRQRRPNMHTQAARPQQHTQSTTNTSRPPIPLLPVNNSNNTADIATLLVQQQRMSSLPTRDLTVFNGEPLNYRPFLQAFEHRVEGNTTSNKDRLYYLEQFTSGQPQELVRSCLHMDPDRGYREAKRLLQVHFGDEFKLTSAYVDKALNWMNIPPDNGDALQSYALFLRSCFNLMRTLQYMDELNLPSNLRLLVAKLPYKIRERWRTHAFDIREKDGTKAKFGDLVGFLERQARILQSCHITPILASLHWLPVQYRIHFKVLTFTFKALHGQAPAYITEIIHPYSNPRSLRSADQHLLVVPRTRLKTKGDRAFEAAAPRLWNALPLELRTAPSEASFKKQLKTHFFRQAFGHL